MKQIIVCGAILLGTGMAECHAQAPSTNSSASDGQTPLYDVRGIIDPGFNGMVAFAAKVACGWGLQQSITHQPAGGATTHLCIYVRMDSPDGHTTIEILPEFPFHYDNLPGMQQLYQWQAAHGQSDPMRIPPMAPVDLLTKLFVPRYARRCGVQYRITGQQGQ